MLSRNEIKYIQSLCQKKQRLAEGLFIAEGTKLVEEVLHSSFKVKKIYALTEWADSYKGEISLEIVTEVELERISSLQTPNQVLAVIEQQIPENEPIFSKAFTIALDGIQDPGNLGTIIRIADWFGINQIIASEDTVELYNPKVIQSTMGSITRVQVWYQSLPNILANVKVPVYGAMLNGNNMHNETVVSEALLVIGNESKGISKELLPFITHPVTIPRIGGAESLNAGVAAGILVSHLRKS